MFDNTWVSLWSLTRLLFFSTPDAVTWGQSPPGLACRLVQVEPWTSPGCTVVINRTAVCLSPLAFSSPPTPIPLNKQKICSSSIICILTAFLESKTSELYFNIASFTVHLLASHWTSQLWRLIPLSLQQKLSSFYPFPRHSKLWVLA